MRGFVPQLVPRDFDPRLWNILDALQRWAQDESRAVASVVEKGNNPGVIIEPDNPGMEDFFYLPGRPDGQIGHGGDRSGGFLKLRSTRHTTRGLIYLGSQDASAYDDVNDRLGIGTVAPAALIHVVGGDLTTAETIVRPTSTISTGSWLGNRSGTSLHLDVDEVTPDETFYIQSSNPVNSSTCEVKFAAMSDPLISTGHELRVWARLNPVVGGANTLTTNFVENVTVRATKNTVLTTSWQQIVLALSEAEADSITNYGDLRVQMLRAGGSSGQIEIDQIEFSVATGAVATSDDILQILQAGDSQAKDMLQNLDSADAEMSGFDATGQLFFSDGTNRTTLTGAASITAYGLTLPAAQGAANTFLLNDGAGVLSWDTGSSIDHGLLTGLGDDDHPQYYLVDASRGMDAADFNEVSANPGDTDTLWVDDGSNYIAGSLIWEQDMVVLGELSVGPPGFEQGSITVNGAAYDAVLKSNDFGGTRSASAILHRHSTNANIGASLVMAKAHTDDSSHAILLDDELIGTIGWVGQDGTDYAFAASIEAYVDGTPGSNDMPARLVFSTSADGSQSPAPAMTILSTQVVDFDNTPTVAGTAVALVDADHGGFTGLSDDDHSQYWLLAGRSGGQTGFGGSAASENLIVSSTSHATKGTIRFGDTVAASRFYEDTNRMAVNTASSDGQLHVAGSTVGIPSGYFTFADSTDGTDEGVAFRIISTRSDGVNGVTQNSSLKVEANITQVFGTDGPIVGIYSLLDTSVYPAFNSPSTYAGIRGRGNTTGATATAYTGSELIGILAEADHEDSGLMPYLTGLKSSAEGSDGNITTAAGLLVVGNFVGPTVTNFRGIDINNPSASGGAAITNNYGIYMADMTTGTNDWAIYSLGADSYFKDRLRTAAALRLIEAGGADSADYVEIKAPATVGTSYGIELDDNAPTNDALAKFGGVSGAVTVQEFVDIPQGEIYIPSSAFKNANGAVESSFGTYPNNIHAWAVAFDGGDDGIMIHFQVPDDADVSQGMQFVVEWGVKNATATTAVIRVLSRPITSGEDMTAAFSSGLSASVSVNVTNNDLQRVSIGGSLSGIVAGDTVRLILERQASNVVDTFNDDLFFIGLRVLYTRNI